MWFVSLRSVNKTKRVENKPVEQSRDPLNPLLHSQVFTLLQFPCPEQLFTAYNLQCLFSLSLFVFTEWVLSIWVFSLDGHYLNVRVFLSKNYPLIVAPQKFDVPKTNIC